MRDCAKKYPKTLLVLHKSVAQVFFESNLVFLKSFRSLLATIYLATSSVIPKQHCHLLAVTLFDMKYM